MLHKYNKSFQMEKNGIRFSTLTSSRSQQLIFPLLLSCVFLKKVGIRFQVDAIFLMGIMFSYNIQHENRFLPPPHSFLPLYCSRDSIYKFYCCESSFHFSLTTLCFHEEKYSNPFPLGFWCLKMFSFIRFDQFL